MNHADGIRNAASIKCHQLLTLLDAVPNGISIACLYLVGYFSANSNQIRCLIDTKISSITVSFIIIKMKTAVVMKIIETAVHCHEEEKCSHLMAIEVNSTQLLIYLQHFF